MNTTLNQDYVSQYFKGINEGFTKLFKNNAIWLDKPIKTSREVKKRITTNDEICIVNGSLVDCNDKPTHVIVGTYGTLQNNILEIECKDLSNGEVIRVRL